MKFERKSTSSKIIEDIELGGAFVFFRSNLVPYIRIINREGAMRYMAYDGGIEIINPGTSVFPVKLDTITWDLE